MTLTNKQLESQQRAQEQRNSRIKRAQKFIEKEQLLGLVNNIKWQLVFDWLHDENLLFDYRCLPSGDWETCEQVREIDTSAVLLNDSGDFIEYLEIKEVRIPESEPLQRYLEAANIVFDVQTDVVIVHGYRVPH